MAKKNRNAHGSGSIRQRPDGRWEARFTYTDDLGQPQRGSVYGATQRECRQKLTTTLAQVDAGTYRKTKRYTVAQWLNEWFDTYSQNWKPHTQASYRANAKRYIIPHLGNVRLTTLNPVQVQKWVNRLSRDYGLSARTVHLAYAVLHESLKQALAVGLIPTDPCQAVRLPKMEQADLHPLMDNDISRFLEAAKGDMFEPIYVLALMCGLRQAEILGLRWEDVDGDCLHVRGQLQRLQDGTYTIASTKSAKERDVPLPPAVADVLQQRQRVQAEWQLAAGPAWSNSLGLVFTDELGHPLAVRRLTRHFKAIVTAIGRPEVRFHDLRHTCAIMALQSGCNIKSVQEMLGHSSAAFTMDVYAGVSDAMKDDTRSRMEDVFQNFSKGQKSG